MRSNDALGKNCAESGFPIPRSSSTKWVSAPKHRRNLLSQAVSAQSYYQTSAGALALRPALSARFDCDIAIIGGGFAGLHTALSLLERGARDVVLLEAEHIGFGASGRNGGFVFGGYSLGESSLLKQLGPVRAKEWYLRTTQAVERIRCLIQRYQIDCDLVDHGVLWANWFHDPQVLENRRRLLAQYFDTHWQPVAQLQLRQMINSPRYSGALFERNALHLHPLKFARGLARAGESLGLRVFEKSPVARLQADGAHWVLETPDGALHARSVVVAGGGYLSGQGAALAKLRRSLMPIATYVLASEPLGTRARELINTQAAIYDSRFAFDYYRLTPDFRLIWGGGISVRDRPPNEVAEFLRQDIAKVFPALTLCQGETELRVAQAWSGLMSYARHEMPQIGKLSSHGPELWYAQAFGGHGLAPTCVAGETLAQAILENDPRYQELAAFGLSSTFGLLGLLAAQCTYSYLQTCDRIKSERETRAGAVP